MQSQLTPRPSAFAAPHAWPPAAPVQPALELAQQQKVLPQLQRVGGQVRQVGVVLQEKREGPRAGVLISGAWVSGWYSKQALTQAQLIHSPLYLCSSCC